MTLLNGASIRPDDKVFLRPDTMIEPLIDQWYAWSYLISPATLAANIVGRHLTIMESFVNAPHIHERAVNDPRMSGGPFVDVPVDQVDAVRELINTTRERRKDLIEFAIALAEFDQHLCSEADGFCLEPLYAKVPEALRGYVELVYDLNNHPSIRILEPILYRSSLHDESAQSLLLSRISQDDRPFVLSSPRIETEESVAVRIPFSAEGIDILSNTRFESRRARDILDALHLNGGMESGVCKFLTTEPPQRYTPYKGPGVRWRYFGHACILLETKHVTVLADPVLSYTYENSISRYTYEDLPDHIDFVLITHNHQDHILFETLLQLRHKVGTVVVPRGGGGALQDPSLRLILKSIGFKNIVELEMLESISHGDNVIMGLPFLGEHADLNIPTKLAYWIRLGNHTFIAGADACNVEPKVYEHVYPSVGDVDVLFLGMECDGAPLSWVYGPLMSKRLNRKMDQSRRLSGCNYERALSLVNRFNPKEVYVYAMGQEPWLRYIMSKVYTEQSDPIIASNKLMDVCQKRGITAERLFGEKEILIQYP